MAERRVDVAIVGAGTAGLAAHAAAREHTESLLLIEGGAHGTMCARVGCMPSKLLIAAAEAKRCVDEAGRFGIRVDAASVDGEAVMRRVRALRDDFVASVIAAEARIPAEQRLDGSARFVAPGVLQVGETTVHAGRVVLATGSKPIVPDAYRALGALALTTDSVFELPRLPRSLAVVGGGPVGLELGQAFHALGVRTRLFHKGKTLGPAGDAKVAQAATELFAKSMPCELRVDVQPAGPADGEVELAWRDAAGAERRERYDFVLVAIGRRPQLAELGLEAAGLQLDEDGVPLHDGHTLRCGDSVVFIAGDADAHRPLLHEAAADGRLAGDNAGRFPEVRRVEPRTALAIAFTEPQFASVGKPLDELGERAAVGEVSFEEQGRARVIGRNAGLARLYADRDGGRLLGAQIVGPSAEHLAHLLAWAVERQLTVADLLALPYYHPVIEEGLRTALKQLRHRLSRSTSAPPSGMDCGPGD